MFEAGKYILNTWSVLCVIIDRLFIVVVSTGRIWVILFNEALGELC